MSKLPIERFEIKPAAPEDTEPMALLLERINASRNGLPLPSELPAETREKACLEERTYWDGYWSQLAMDGDTLAGFANGYSGDSKNSPAHNTAEHRTKSEYLWLLMVDPDYQRRGLGRHLLRLAGCQAKLAGARELTLKTTALNLGARELYESEDFELSGLILSDSQGPMVGFRKSLA
jgi:ribosomal protein S18 acetylase RimI-like enzyme